MRGPAIAHELGFGDQVLQPVTMLHSLILLVALGLLYRQQRKVPINRLVSFMIGLRLTVGLSCKVYLDPFQSQLVFALSIAVFAGSLVAFARPSSPTRNLNAS